MSGYILAIDQGTTSTRSLIFDDRYQICGSSQTEFTQYFPKSGWVEHDVEEIWQTVLATAKGAIESARLTPQDLNAIGITNQRETVVIWDRETGEALHKAIVWQDRRTADRCIALKAAGQEAEVNARTGLLLDPYFSGTKLAWLLDNVAGARQAAEAGRLAFGTIDSFLIWRMTGGERHVTDATNASRTLLYNIAINTWDESLLELFKIPPVMLPQVLDSAAEFGVARADFFGAAIPILGVAGDQQAATLGNACFEPGMLKSTYGTGCFALLNTGAERVTSRNRLLTTLAYRLKGQTTYALEGSIFVAGAAVQWLRDGLGLIESAEETGRLATEADPHQEVYLVPAFTGLGAPYWDPEARGGLFGLTRATGPAEFAKAALESVCYQTVDLANAMKADWIKLRTQQRDRALSFSDENAISSRGGPVLRVDGGMVASDWTMQCLADLLNAPVDRPSILETTALGAAWLAGSEAGVWPYQQGFAASRQTERRFEPQMDAATRAAKLAGWADAVQRILRL